MPARHATEEGWDCHPSPAQRSRGYATQPFPACSFQSRLAFFLRFDHLRECLLHLAGEHDVFHVRRDEFQSKFRSFSGSEFHQPRADGCAIAEEHLNPFGANNLSQGHLQCEI